MRGVTLITSGGGPRYWTLAADPNKYRISDAIAALSVDWWATKGHSLSGGDKVAIWQYRNRQGRRGVLALGEITDGPKERSDADNPYWIAPVDPAMVAKVERVGVSYIPLDEPLWGGGPYNELLTSLSVARARGGTVFKLKPDQWNDIVSASGQDADAVSLDVEETRRRTDLSPTQKEVLCRPDGGRDAFAGMYSNNGVMAAPSSEAPSSLFCELRISSHGENRPTTSASTPPTASRSSPIWMRSSTTV